MTTKTRSREISLPGADAMALYLVMRSGESWIKLDYDITKPTIHIPVEALPALRELIKTLDEEERGLTIKSNQHCTSIECDYTFSHTAALCMSHQPQRCDCAYCYPKDESWATWIASSAISLPPPEGEVRPES